MLHGHPCVHARLLFASGKHLELWLPQFLHTKHFYGGKAAVSQRAGQLTICSAWGALVLRLELGCTLKGVVAAPQLQVHSQSAACTKPAEPGHSGYDSRVRAVTWQRRGSRDA